MSHLVFTHASDILITPSMTAMSDNNIFLTSIVKYGLIEFDIQPDFSSIELIFHIHQFVKETRNTSSLIFISYPF